MSLTNPLASLSGLVLLVIGLAQLAALVFSLLHAIRVRADAFPAAGKQSKLFWSALLAVSLVLRLTISSPLDLFGIIASIAAIVYIVDVRPAINDVLRGPRW
jgi:hypothetical protein